MRKIITNEKDLNNYIDDIKKINLDGKRSWVVEIKPFRRIRSLASNRLYWMWLACISHETGNDIETLHLYFRQKYLGASAIDVFGESVSEVPSTTKLDSKAFSDYLNAIKLQMIEDQAISLPEPGEQYWDEFVTQYAER